MNIWEIHPALVHFPLTLLFASTALDIFAFRRKREGTARLALGMLIAGLLFIPLVAIAGIIAYFTVPPHSEAANVRIIVHALSGVSSAILYGLVLLVRWRARDTVARPSVVTLSVAAALFLTATGALGGYLVYHDGVGVVPATPRATQAGSVEDP